MGNSLSFKPWKANGWNLERGARVAREEQDAKDAQVEAAESREERPDDEKK